MHIFLSQKFQVAFRQHSILRQKQLTRFGVHDIRCRQAADELLVKNLDGVRR